MAYVKYFHNHQSGSQHAGNANQETPFASFISFTNSSAAALKIVPHYLDRTKSGRFLVTVTVHITEVFEKYGNQDLILPSKFTSSGS